MNTLHIEQLPVEQLRPYEKNARKHGDRDITAIAASIEEFGFNDPVGIYGPDNLIVEGHGRVLAAKRIGLKTVPCIRLDHMTDEQRRAYALAHNKTAELSDWDFELLPEELAGIFNIDMTEFEFRLPAAGSDWFDRTEKNGAEKQEGNDEYNEFVEKFEIKKTTDDCYTPDNIYEAVAEWVAAEYNLDRHNFVRPFYPGGDYENERYAPDAVVVDNPPFSILAKICRFYMERGIKFFLFAPTLTLFSADDDRICHIAADCDITYENGAVVNTSFKTNLEAGIALRTVPELTAKIEIINKENTKSDSNLLKYAYPHYVITAAKASGWSSLGIDFKLPRTECVKIKELDAQKPLGLAIFGGGFLMSKKAAAQAAQAAQAARAAGIAVEDINERGEVVWKLSEREWGIVKSLDADPLSSPDK